MQGFFIYRGCQKMKNTVGILKHLYFISVLLCVISGCAETSNVSQKPLAQTFVETGSYDKSKKYLKNGITVVYLTGTPYEIGFAHGKLCRKEILEANKQVFDLYEVLLNHPESQWLKKSRWLENFIPKEYLNEMRGISDGADIEYDKILFLNTAKTISMANKCFAFSFR